MFFGSQNGQDSVLKSNYKGTLFFFFKKKEENDNKARVSYHFLDFSRGGGFRGMRNRALMGCMSQRAGERRGRVSYALSSLGPRFRDSLLTSHALPVV